MGERSRAISTLHSSVRGLERQSDWCMQNLEHSEAEAHTRGTLMESPAISAAQWSSHTKASLEAKMKDIAAAIQEELRAHKAHLDLHGRRHQETETRIGRERAEREAQQSKLAELELWAQHVTEALDLSGWNIKQMEPAIDLLRAIDADPDM